MKLNVKSQIIRLLVCLTIVFTLAGCDKKPQQGGPVPYDDWESASVETNGIRIHYWRTGGEGKPVMIMAHGVTDYGLSWASLAARFQADYDIIMYDARGHGFSQKPSGPYDLSSHVEDLVGLIKALSIEKPILIGHSMGSGIVARTAANYPDLPRAVIMEDPVMAEMLKMLSEVVISDWKKMIEADKVRGKQQLMNIARTKRHPGWSDFEYDHWAEAKLLVHPNVVNVLRDFDIDGPAKEYPRIIASTLILKADANKESRKKHIEVAALLPKGKIVHIDGASHLVRLDKPQETERQIRSFLAELK